MTMTRSKASQGLRIGDQFKASRTFTEAEVRSFARLSRDYNPVHFEPRWAQLKRFEGTVCHGLLVGSLVTEIGGQIGWLASAMGFRFRRPVYPGDTVTCRLTIVDLTADHRARAEAVFVNQDGLTVAQATLDGRVPGPEERRLLRIMMDAGDPTNGLDERAGRPDADNDRKFDRE